MAARLCKADLVSGMVYEFPELQGLWAAITPIMTGSMPVLVRPFARIMHRLVPLTTFPHAGGLRGGACR